MMQLDNQPARPLFAVAFHRRQVTLLLLTVMATLACPAAARWAVAEEKVSALADALKELNPHVLPANEREAARAMVREQLRTRLQSANNTSRDEWLKVRTPKEWAAFRKRRMDGLRESLGKFPEPPKAVRTTVTRTLKGDGYVLENILYESRPGWWVTANLYRPAKPKANMPGIIISHSHHRPKEHSELQDMGMTWARAGCVVLAPDHLGHGERGQHGFRSSDDFPREFRVSRQDYYFRYDNSIQLYLAGESLMGWMAWDLMRGVDVLLNLPPLGKGGHGGVDEDKIILLGAVAGGGDPCAVTAALDERIACAVPFNFGGPQPETRYPLPEDAETWFNYAGSGSWESTRNLAFSAGGGARFLPWEIVAAVAPRKLVFAHEFGWHRERDPVWKRLEKVYQLQDARDNLAYTHGRGELRGRPPEATHCTHIGKFHRQRIHEALEKWFDVRAEEFSDNRSSADLRAWTAQANDKLRPQKLHVLLASATAKALAKRREQRRQLTAAERKAQLRKELRKLLGDVEPATIAHVSVDDTKLADDQLLTVERITLTGEDGSKIPLLQLRPNAAGDDAAPVVVCLAQAGKAALLKHHSDEIAKLISGGVAVCLPDVRNTGETGDGSRGRYSSSTSRAATALMVGDPLIAGQLRDVRTTLKYLRSRKDVDRRRIALWGHSLAELNDAQANFAVPRRIDGRPRDVEPLGGMLALLAALFEEEIAAIQMSRGLASFQSALGSPYVYVPLDSVLPGLLQHADVADIAAAVAPLPLRASGMVDAYNRELSPVDAAKAFQPASEHYKSQRAAAQLSVVKEGDSPAQWLIAELKKEDR